MIKLIAIDLGGVIMHIDNDEPARRFKEIGVKDVDQLLDPYTQAGFFGDLEEGKITDEDFRVELSKHAGRELSWDECQYGWMGYMKQLPAFSLPILDRLREEGYRVVLASNTNPFIQRWADSTAFSPEGRSISQCFDALYRSYEMQTMKPSETFFRYILEHENVNAEDVLFIDDSAKNCAAAAAMGINTLQPTNGVDWSEAVDVRLEELNK